MNHPFRRVRTLGHESLESRQLLDASGVLAAAGEPGDAFTLLDVNPTSPTYDQMVSPATYNGEATAYYFMHST